MVAGIYQFNPFLPAAFAAFGTRKFEASKDFPLFLKSVGTVPDQFCTVKQVHGDRVLWVGGPSKVEEADGLVTGERGLALVIWTADCAPLFFLDPEAPAVGLCHAGWRGAKSGIVSQTVEMLWKRFGSEPSRLRVAIGPALRESCYEVGKEFENYFPGFVRQEGLRFFFDLVGAVKKELIRAEVPENSITDSGLCTACSVDQFFSARREGSGTGRFLSAIVLK